MTLAEQMAKKLRSCGVPYYTPTLEGVASRLIKDLRLVQLSEDQSLRDYPI